MEASCVLCSSTRFSPSRARKRGFVNRFRRAVFDVGDDEAGVEAERVASMRATVRRPAQDLASWRVSAEPRTTGLFDTARSVRTHPPPRRFSSPAASNRAGRRRNRLGWPRTIPSPRVGRSGHRLGTRCASSSSVDGYGAQAGADERALRRPTGSCRGAAPPRRDASARCHRHGSAESSARRNGR